MKKISIKTKFCSFTVMVLLFFPITASSGQNDKSIPETSSTEKTSYSVPAEKAELWESLKNTARKDYDVCLEHCGYEQNCMNKCERAYENRLDNHYRMLLNKKESAPGK